MPVVVVTTVASWLGLLMFEKFSVVEARGVPLLRITPLNPPPGRFRSTPAMSSLAEVSVKAVALNDDCPPIQVVGPFGPRTEIA